MATPNPKVKPRGAPAHPPPPRAAQGAPPVNPPRTAAPPNPPPPASQAIQTTAPPATPAPSLFGAQAPEWLRAAQASSAPRGLEHMDDADIILPRLVILQDLSPLIKARTPGLAQGDLVNNLSAAKYAGAGQPLRVVLVKYSKQRIRFGAKPGDPIQCRSFDAVRAVRLGGKMPDDQPTDECQHCVYKEFKEPEPGEKSPGSPDCTEIHNFAALLPDHGMEQIVLSLKSTQTRTARQVLSQARLSGYDLFAGVWEFLTVEDGSGAQKFWNLKARPAGFAAQEQYRAASAFYASLEKKTFGAVDTDDEGGDHGQTSPAAAPRPPATAPGGRVEEGPRF